MLSAAYAYARYARHMMIAPIELRATAARVARRCFMRYVARYDARAALHGYATLALKLPARERRALLYAVALYAFTFFGDTPLISD